MSNEIDCYRIWVAAAADSTDPNGFGGLPYHLVESGKTIGVVDGGFPFKIDSYRNQMMRLLWNSFMKLKTGQYGGYQYSDLFLNYIWEGVPRPHGEYAVINIFQLYPQVEMQYPYRKFFYLDQSLHDVFEYYGTGAKISGLWKKQVLERERAQYHAADGVIFRSHWAAKRAITHYDLPSQKVHVVLPGANIPISALDEFDAKYKHYTHASEPLKLIFIGKEWKRKGLDRLLNAMRLATDAGARLSLTVIGVKQGEVPERLTHGISIRWISFFDKSRNPSGFIRLLVQHDVGVLLSRSEAGGVSLREFGRLGLPVIAPDTGGSPEFAMSDSALIFAPTDTDEKIANSITDLASNRKLMNELKANAWEQRHKFDWRMSVEQLADVLYK